MLTCKKSVGIATSNLDTDPLRCLSCLLLSSFRLAAETNTRAACALQIINQLRADCECEGATTQSCPVRSSIATQRGPATRFPSMRTKVSLGSKPRRLTWTVPSPIPIGILEVFWLRVAPISCGSLLRKSVAFRTPNFSMSPGR